MEYSSVCFRPEQWFSLNKSKQTSGSSVTKPNERVATIVPHRQNIKNPANWLDRKCHRSLYSYHNRVALQLALETDTKTAVTFLGYACSGAKLTDGILLDYYGVEKVRKKNFLQPGTSRLKTPQLARLIEELCIHKVEVKKPVELNQIKVPTDRKGRIKPVKMPKCGSYKKSDYLRPIDMLILSIGGNDIGFVPLIAHAVLQDAKSFERKARKFNLLRLIASHFLAHDVEVAENERLPQLPKRFDAFSQALNAVGIPIRKTGKKLNVIMTGFPIVQEFRVKILLIISDSGFFH